MFGFLITSQSISDHNKYYDFSEFRPKLVVLLWIFTSSGSGRSLWHDAAGWSQPLSVSPYLRLHGFYDNSRPTYDSLRSTSDNINIIQISKYVIKSVFNVMKKII